jgi:Zn-dependent metalloprotease
MRLHKCCHSFIPQHVVENLARAGVEGARRTIMQSQISRSKRNEKPIDMPTFLGVSPVPPQNAARIVYDCLETWGQRVNKVWTEEKQGNFPDQTVKDVFTFAGVVRDYLKTALERNSIDNQGMDLILNVHYGTKYMNAFWDGDEMTFGDGDGEIFTSFAKSLDVVAHELAHGVTQFTANLEYQGQSGALNEHFSDVFGSAITQYYLKQTADQADWLIGDEIMGPSLYGEALRSMCAPGSAYDNALLGKDPQPAHMKDYYAGPEDNQGVHINSGIPNKAFYLVSREIGTDKAALIWYKALLKLWATANFNDAVAKLVDAARELIQAGKIPLGSTQRVRAAFKEVGLPT